MAKTDKRVVEACTCRSGVDEKLARRWRPLGPLCRGPALMSWSVMRSGPITD